MLWCMISIHQMKLGNGLISKRYSLLLFNWLRLPASFVGTFEFGVFLIKVIITSISILVSFFFNLFQKKVSF